MSITKSTANNLSNCTHAIFVNRGQPLLITHMWCIQQILDLNLVPVIMIGSSNGSDKFFSPISNPLTAAQRNQQLKISLAKNKIESYLISELPDVGNSDEWIKSILAILAENEINPNKCAFSYFPKKENITKQDRFEEIGELEEYVTDLQRSGLNILIHKNNNQQLNSRIKEITDTDADRLSASTYRKKDFFDEKNFREINEILAAPNYIRELINKARAKNPILDELKIPKTMFDLTLDRCNIEAGITIESLLLKIKNRTSITLEELLNSVEQAVQQR